MYKITNVAMLGTEYNVADLTGKIIGTIQVIPHTEILDASLGDYDENNFSIDQYIEQSTKLLCGFSDAGIEYYNTLWYATNQKEVVLSEIIEYAIKNKYDKIILEHLEDAEA